MTHNEISQALERAEAALSRGEGPGGTGFWEAVGEVKGSPALVDEFADRISSIDRRAFEEWALLVVPEPLGTALASTAALVGASAVAVSSKLSEPAKWLVFGGGTVALLAATHGLGHVLVGRAMGMRFTSWFVGSVQQPQPGVKVDYGTYLQTEPSRRAWMHAAGAITTKVVPFALIPAARATGNPSWVSWLLAAAGAGMIATDAAWSTKKSDWKKFRREMSYVSS